MKRKDYTGLEGFNNFGSKIIVSKYRNYNDIDIYFPEYDYTSKNRYMDDFKKGKITCPHEKRYYGVGFLGFGKYDSYDYEKKEDLKVYKVWSSMIMRCHCENYLNKKPQYKNVTICDEWYNFQNFAEWFYDNYYEIEGEIVELDKDLVCKGKIYSPNNCVFIPSSINKIIVRNESKRNGIIGIRQLKSGRFNSRCKDGNNKEIGLGTYDTIEEAFESYKNFKEKLIKSKADEYKDLIPKKVYELLYNYKVEIID